MGKGWDLLARFLSGTGYTWKKNKSRLYISILSHSQCKKFKCFFDLPTSIISLFKALEKG